MTKFFILGALFFALTAGTAVYTARAQSGVGALVVATCGTLAQNFAVGSTRQITVNTNGQVCQ